MTRQDYLNRSEPSGREYNVPNLIKWVKLKISFSTRALTFVHSTSFHTMFVRIFLKLVKKKEKKNASIGSEADGTYSTLYPPHPERRGEERERGEGRELKSVIVWVTGVGGDSDSDRWW